MENIKITNRGFELSCELKNVPVAFVNAIRRILLSAIPTVVIRDIQILDNTTQMPHEMLRHRVEMLPINVSPDDATTIRDAKIELRVIPETKDRILTTDDFVVESGREKILMKDRDMDTPLHFLKVRAGESVHIKGRLAVENVNVSQVCTVSTNWHIDPELAKVDRKNFVDSGKDVREFDNFYIQRSYSRDEHGRPNWFDLGIESVGVMKSRDIFKLGLAIFRKRLEDYMKDAMENIQREQEEGSYTISLEQGGHTMGALLQEVIYSDQNVGFVSYDIPHPLRNTMVLRFHTKKVPESVLRTAKETIEEYCSRVEKVL